MGLVLEVLPASGGLLCFYVLPTQAALALPGALWGPSVGVNLKQRAGIPVGSVTVHAWLMRPRRQVTGVRAEGERRESSDMSSGLWRMESGLGDSDNMT